MAFVEPVVASGAAVTDSKAPLRTRSDLTVRPGTRLCEERLRLTKALLMESSDRLLEPIVLRFAMFPLIPRNVSSQ
jgi:hypothetical protein